MSPSRDGDAVVMLVSGGLDSLLLLGEALGRGESVAPLYVRQGALWENAEVDGLERLLEALRADHGCRVGQLVQARVDFPAGYRARWALDAAAEPPGPDTPDDAVYLPGRNLALLLAAASHAESHGLKTIRIGTLGANPFADGTDLFFRRFEDLFESATGWRVNVEKPLCGVDKAALMRAHAALPWRLTSSCLRPAGGAHCGRCNKCAERRRAFAAAGLPDPTPYCE
ncbi:MAG: 7-cyano-7-deazaguanine synthase [Candidatus Sumerlaeia bacterium]